MASPKKSSPTVEVTVTKEVSTPKKQKQSPSVTRESADAKESLSTIRAADLAYQLELEKLKARSRDYERRRERGD
jgi:hypothetical protein